MTAERVADLASLVERAEAEARSDGKRARTTIIAVVALNLFVIAYMSWIRSSLAQFDAEGVVQIAGSQVEGALPGLRDRAVDAAVAAAPDIADRVQNAALEAPARMRVALEEWITQRFRQDLGKFEESADDVVGTFIESRLTDLENAYPGGTDEQKLERLMEDTLDSYRAVVELHIEVVSAGFVEKAMVLRTYLERLRRADGLSEKEALDREILEAWISLIHHHRILAEAVGEGGR